MLACIITAYYEVILEEEMVIRGMSDEHYKWLMFVFAFDKNYIGPRFAEDSSPILFESLFDII